MKPSEILEYIKKNKLEKKYNASFNMNKINSPKVTFYSVEKMKDFENTGIEISVANYYKYLSKEFEKEGYENFREYLKTKVQYWKNKENNFSINEDEALYYLAKKFLIDPVNGRLKELKVKDSLEKEFSDFEITEPTPEEDLKNCWDFKVSNQKFTFYLQNKPESFFYGLKTTTKNSFTKVKNASFKNGIPIFFTKYNENKNICEVALMEKNNYKFKPLSEIKLETQGNIMIQSKKVMDSFEKITNTKKRKVKR